MGRPIITNVQGTAKPSVSKHAEAADMQTGEVACAFPTSKPRTVAMQRVMGSALSQSRGGKALRPAKRNTQRMVSEGWMKELTSKVTHIKKGVASLSDQQNFIDKEPILKIVDKILEASRRVGSQSDAEAINKLTQGADAIERIVDQLLSATQLPSDRANLERQAKYNNTSIKHGKDEGAGLPPVPSAPPPPPPPPPPPKSISPPAGQTAQEAGRSSLFESIRNQPRNKLRNHKDSRTGLLSKNRTDSKTTSQEVVRSAEQYLSESSREKYKSDISKKIIAAQGRDTDNSHLNALMCKHAEHTGHTGYIDTVGERFDDERGKYVSTSSRTGSYSAYVCGRNTRFNPDGSSVQSILRATQVNPANDFNASIWSYLDTYLDELVEDADKAGTTLSKLLKERLGVDAVVQSPQAFFAVWPELMKKLKPINLSVSDLEANDITKEFVELLISGDKKRAEAVWASITLRNEKKAPAYKTKTGLTGYHDFIENLEKMAASTPEKSPGRT